MPKIIIKFWNRDRGNFLSRLFATGKSINCHKAAEMAISVMDSMIRFKIDFKIVTPYIKY